MMTFCLGFRHWYARHLDRCLTSLARFNLPIIVTVGDGSQVIADIVTAHGATPLMYSMSEWSRSVALNQAAEVATTPYVVCTDADMIFPSHWLRVAETYASPHRLCLTDSRDTVPGETSSMLSIMLDDVLHWHNMDNWLLRNTKEHSRVGQGAAAIIPRHWFVSVGGFDEFYSCWGCEDEDIVDRAQWDGLDVVWLPHTFVAHQWHRRDWPTQEQYAQVQRNREYLAARRAERGPIARNGTVSSGAC